MADEAAAGASGSPQEAQALGGGAGAARARAESPLRVLLPDATTTPLPYAPSLKVVCLYGVGIPTERAYHYLKPPPAPPVQAQHANASKHGAPVSAAAATNQTAQGMGCS